MKALNEEGAGSAVTLAPASRTRPFSKSELRKQARERAFQRVEKSASLAVIYPGLKSMAVDLLYFDRDIVSWGHGLRYRANLETARSILHFHCPSPLCQNGGFDLSKALSCAVAEHQKSVEGKVRCLGVRDEQVGKPTPCETVLHFKITLTFKTKVRAKPAGAIGHSGARPRPGQA